MAYAATASILALVVDLTRIPIYIYFEGRGILDDYILIIALVFAAIMGVQLGKKWLLSWKDSWIRSGILVALIVSGFMYVYEASNGLGGI